MRRNALALAITTSLTLSGCATVQEAGDFVKNTYKDNKGLIIGCTLGAGAGALADGERGAIIGLVAGCSLGRYYDVRRKEVKFIAQNNNLDVAFEDIPVTVTLKGDAKQTTTKMLSASIAGDNMFPSGKATLSSNAKASFVEMAKKYKATGAKVMIIGHTDSDGSAAYNQVLSEARAEAVAKIFASEGIAKKNIYYQGAGETQPISSNTTIDGKIKNRRVEVVEAGIASGDIMAEISNEIKGSTSSSKNAISDETAAEMMSRYAAARASNIRNAQYRGETKVSQANHQAPETSMDFGGVKINNLNSNLYSLIGEPVKPSFEFSMFATAHADDLAMRSSCIGDEPAHAGDVKR